MRIAITLERHRRRRRRRGRELHASRRSPPTGSCSTWRPAAPRSAPAPSCRRPAPGPWTGDRLLPAERRLERRDQLHLHGLRRRPEQRGGDRLDHRQCGRRHRRRQPRRPTRTPRSTSWCWRTTRSSGTTAITGATNGANGTVAVNNNGTPGDTTDDFVVYTPNADFNGTDTFTYTVDLGRRDRDRDRQRHRQRGRRHRRRHGDHHEDTPVNILVLAQRHLRGHAGHHRHHQRRQRHGRRQRQRHAGDTADDFVVYTPNADFNGADTFTYTVTSGGVTETATVNVTVNAVADIVDDTATTDEDTAGQRHWCWRTTRSRARRRSPAPPTATNGTVAVNDNGTPATPPTTSWSTRRTPTSTAPTSFTYTVTSGGVTETATVNVTVNAVADIADDSVTTNEDTAVNVAGAGERHVRGHRPAITGTTNGANGTVAVNDNGTAGRHHRRLRRLHAERRLQRRRHASPTR